MPRIALTQQRGVWISPAHTQGASGPCFSRFDAANARSEARVPLLSVFQVWSHVEVSRQGRHSWNVLVGKEQEKQGVCKGSRDYSSETSQESDLNTILGVISCIESWS